ncbi:IS110 family transposase [Flavihumibacter petaseus]|uniref:Putative transposase n=1 Tax=Flavihumibacter petaseus NBRC 106054 TaxID=1220578 RepID=A0A0E9N7P8_9BACT|nr:IS110 family transposase [Flavihumibacter petaseus]GAO45746.1 putative transposase [Flavihumibacter petaseus NBRC 106054]
MSKGTKNEPAGKAAVSLPIVHLDAAGIDVSATMHMVAVPEGREKESIRQFGCFTRDLHELATWLKRCGITTVAMESTGVYWRPLFSVLLEYGFDVALVNSRQIKNVSGRKTDKADARWIQKLHSCGLLTSSYLPDEPTEKLRTLVRHRRRLREDASTYVLRMQKSMELMNIKLHSVISDIMGKTGKAIIEAILGGERNPKAFLPLVNGRIKASADTIEQSLTGTWNEEQLFLLAQNYDLHRYIEHKIEVCEKKIEEQLQLQAAMMEEGIIESCPTKLPTEKASRKRYTAKNAPNFDAHAYLKRIHGVDVTEIYGVSQTSAMEILAETGTHLRQWENEKKFVAWLNLCPNNKITGGKVISSMVMKKKAGNATQAFRAAANSLQRSDHYLGHYFRKMKSKGGNKYAIIATARKMAIIYYKMITEKVAFNPIQMEEYKEKMQADKIAYYQKKIAQLQQVA